MPLALDPHVRELLQAMAGTGLSRLGSVPASEMRAYAAQLRSQMPSGPPVASIEDVVITSPNCSIPLRIYRTSGEASALIVYFHGGGWTLGSVAEHDPIVRRLAVHTQATVISVDYRLAPEHRFPAAVEDALASVAWAIQHRQRLVPSHTPLLLIGDSSGGNLAAVAAQQAPRAHKRQIAGLALIYPCLDGDIEATALKRFEAPFLTRHQLAWFFDQYIPDHAQRLSPKFAPLRSPSLRGSPPTLIITAEFDLLKEEAEQYARRLEADDCQVKLICYPGMIHGFFGFGELQQAEDVRGEISAFIGILTRTSASPFA